MSKVSTDGPFLFNIYPNDLFYFLKDVGICNFADETSTYISDECLENVLKSPEKNSVLVIRWFENNFMELNTDKLLGITIDRDLKLDKHVLKLCIKANPKISALSRMAKLLSFNKWRTIFKAFVESQFKYYEIL